MTTTNLEQEFMIHYGGIDFLPIPSHTLGMITQWITCRVIVFINERKQDKAQYPQILKCLKSSIALYISCIVVKLKDPW